MPDKKLHIVAFNIPYPPDYGGIIDVFYKIRALAASGVKIYLHCFEYDRPRAPELNQLCEKVFYYERKTGLFSLFSSVPYIVYSRRSKNLLANLSGIDAPVIFEGLHCCYYLEHKNLRMRKKLVRAHNIEYKYYHSLASTARDLASKIFFFMESLKLKCYENKLKYADIILGISKAEAEYFQRKYGNARWMGAFHSNDSVRSIEGMGKYILIHGNLSVPDNEQSVIYAMENILTGINFPVIIAGHQPSPFLEKIIRQNKNITLVRDPDEEEMNRLIMDAHVHLLITFQATGLKLKLLNALYLGRFVVTNTLMTESTGLEKLCETGKTLDDIRKILINILELEFDRSRILERTKYLRDFGNEINLKVLMEVSGFS